MDNFYFYNQGRSVICQLGVSSQHFFLVSQILTKRWWCIITIFWTSNVVYLQWVHGPSHLWKYFNIKVIVIARLHVLFLFLTLIWWKKVFLAMVTKTMILYVSFAFYICSNCVCQFDLWMFKVVINTFSLVINYLDYS